MCSTIATTSSRNGSSKRSEFTVSLHNGCTDDVDHHFAYVNRTIPGLGVPTQSDTLGLSPGDADAAGNWRHN
jgi:hypothetical protein